MIASLAAQVDAGITHIREVVIVAHGNPLGLLSPVVDGVTKTNLKEFNKSRPSPWRCCRTICERGSSRR